MPECSDPPAALGVLDAASPRPVVRARAGGKARGLHELSAAGVAVPPWAVLGVEVLRDFLAAADLGRVLDAELESLGGDPPPARLEQASRRIASAFAAAPVEGAAAAAIAAAYAGVGEGAVAVRSSAIGEDDARLSFAGQHATFLNAVGIDAVTAAVRDCWASVWSVEALRYRLINRLPLAGIESGVVVQSMVAAERSGVMFTVGPTDGGEEQMVISASYGLGEAVVSGAVDPDTIVLERATGAVLETTLGAKELRIDPRPGGGCGSAVVAAADRDRPALAAADLRRLHREGMALERLMGCPQDVEWALRDGELWILQSRPITASQGAGPLRLWDNSNVIESYGELVAPLTYTFARHVYHRVYRGYCELLGVPSGQLARMDGWLSNMLGYFDGRVYYNLLNWYKVVRLIPFYGINRRVLEVSIGAEPLPEELAARQQPFDFDRRASALAVRSRVAVRYAWYFATLRRLVDRFAEGFYRVFDSYDAVEYDGRPAHEVYARFAEMERRLLPAWGRMIVLEASIGLSFGALQALTARWLPAAPEWLLYAAVRAEPDVESVRPLRRLDEIAELIVADPGLRRRVEALPPEGLLAALREDGGAAARSAVERIDAYLDEFGYRNANELKLEEPDLREDPAAFAALLRGAVARVEADAGEGAGDAVDADAYIAANLRGWRRRVYGLVRRRVRRSLTDRERVRFCRTRIFGLSRRMFRAIGADLARVGALEAPDDVFYLRLEELRGCFEGTVAHRELGALVRLRREEEARNRERELPPRFFTRGGVYWEALDRAGEELGGAAPRDGVLRGTPCSPGVVSGEARVLERPADVEGGVLVAYRTDPGWVGVLPSATGLLIERGSPLTHVAVVARELGIPTVVQIPELTRRVRTGMEVTVDGGTGAVALCDREGGDEDGC